MRVTSKLFKTLALLLASSAQLTAFAPTNFFKPYDANLDLLGECKKKQPFKIGANVEYGFDHAGKDWNGNSKNVLKLYEPTQQFISAVRNAPATNTAAANQYAALVALPLLAAIDDGARGHVDINGRFEMVDISVHGRYEMPFKAIPGSLGLSLMLPIRDARMYNNSNSYTYKGERGIFAVDAVVYNQVKDRAAMQENMKRLGNLDWTDWAKTDVGDLVIMLDWANRYKQEKDGLEAVEIKAKLGLSCPTAAERDEDKVFAVALGNDGAWAMPFGVGLNIDFKYHIRLGADAQFEVIFDHTKNYRMKTDLNQTRFMLLNKGNASMDYGFTWKFNLLAEAHRFAYGLSVSAAYEYLKHDDDRLSPQSNAFDASVVNSANWLKEYNTHNLIFKLNWDGRACLKQRFAPQLSVFYKLPIDGKNVLLQDTIGGQLAINF